MALSEDHKPGRPSERERILRAGGTVEVVGVPRSRPPYIYMYIYICIYMYIHMYMYMYMYAIAILYM